MNKMTHFLLIEYKKNSGYRGIFHINLHRIADYYKRIVYNCKN